MNPGTYRSVSDPGQDRIFITFDIDWASDPVFADTIDLVEGHGIPATWFVTHETGLLGRLERNPVFEIGIHPNFNEMFEGRSEEGGMQGLLTRYRELAPSAVSIRCHSLAQNNKMLDIFIRLGFTHDVNLFIPAQSKMELQPFTSWGGLIRVPYFWEEDVHCLFLEEGRENDWNPARFLDAPGLKIFNFHPIHVFLNTEHLSRYDRTRAYHRDREALIGHRNPDPAGGTRYFLETLITEAKKRNMDFGLIREIAVA